MTFGDHTLPLAADTLRTWALDESLKANVMANPVLASAAGRIARRFMAGETTTDALTLIAKNAHRGHLTSIECAGESVRSEEIANKETGIFTTLIAEMKTRDELATVSFDLSHIGSVVSPVLGLTNALAIAEAARDAGTYIMISAESSERTDLVLDLYEKVSDAFEETGITIQARLHRSPADLQRVMQRPGPIRLVKGAFLENSTVAHPRESNELTDAYLAMAQTLVTDGHRVNLATHDSSMVESLKSRLGQKLKGAHVEFEMLQGLGTELLDSLSNEGYATREYVLFGSEWWLYVLNRMAEHPERVITALADLNQAADFGNGK
ncbi:proline dehydrogenase [Arthrobacter alpinus]|uniref:proline dehydrogenase family protein n=1 Tax=Arthrobacter alpinus TaxID=656366 RepID=UPI0005C8327C|nr:proline dehydrogenase family protein [Arthrobacter alpinus]ALV47756.1 proline dehydrogenase [Arthrobacter alpinus]